MLQTFEFIRSHIEFADDDLVTKMAGERLQELFDVICNRSTETGFVEINFDEGFEAVELYGEIKRLNDGLEGQREDRLRVDTENLVLKMHARISELLRLQAH